MTQPTLDDVLAEAADFLDALIAIHLNVYDRSILAHGERLEDHKDGREWAREQQAEWRADTLADLRLQFTANWPGPSQ